MQLELIKNHLEYGEKESFNFLKELRLYKEEHGLGGDSHDISKWSRSERAAYSYDRLDDRFDLFRDLFF